MDYYVDLINKHRSYKVYNLTNNENYHFNISYSENYPNIKYITFPKEALPVSEDDVFEYLADYKNIRMIYTICSKMYSSEDQQYLSALGFSLDINPNIVSNYIDSSFVYYKNIV